MKKSIVCVLSALFLFQSCGIYTGNYTLSEVSDYDGRVQVKTKDYTKSKFGKRYYRVFKEGDQYFGVDDVTDRSTWDTIDPNNVERVRKYNRVLNVLGSAVFMTGAVMGITYGLFMGM